MTNTIKHKTIKNYAGDYTRTDGVNSVHVYSDDFGFGTEWIARANWDNSLGTDPMSTKWECIEQADLMISNNRGS